MKGVYKHTLNTIKARLSAVTPRCQHQMKGRHIQAARLIQHKAVSVSLVPQTTISNQLMYIKRAFCWEQVIAFLVVIPKPKLIQ